MKKLFLLSVICLLIISACKDPNTPNVQFQDGSSRIDSGYVLSDGALVSQIPDIPSLPSGRIEATDNAYTCYCRFAIPLNCYDGCENFGTNSVATQDGYCDFGTREFNICIPQLNPPLPLEALEADCAGRATDSLRETLRFTFQYCYDRAPNLGPCDIRYGCSIRRNDGTIRSFHAARCENDCGWIPLTRDINGHVNLETATYVRTIDQVHCRQFIEPIDRVCAWY